MKGPAFSHGGRAASKRFRRPGARPMRRLDVLRFPALASFRMPRHPFVPALFGFLAAASLPHAAPPAYDFFACAIVNRNYTIGNRLATANGVYQRTESGDWVHHGASDPTITAVAFDPRDRRVVYTSALNGLWRSLDGGRQWRIANDWDMTEARDVVVDPGAPDHVYLALPDGIAVSTDRGQTVVRREAGLPPRGRYTQVLHVDRTRAGRVFAGGETGIYLTEDGARSWRRVFATRDTVYDVQQSPHAPGHWLAATHRAGLQQSSDGGLTWTPVAAAPAAHPLYNVTFDVTQPQRLALGGWSVGVHTSEDGGRTWTPRNAGLPPGHPVWRVGIDPAGRLYASVHGETLFVSADFGRTWQPDTLAGSQVNKFVLVPRRTP